MFHSKHYYNVHYDIKKLIKVHFLELLTNVMLFNFSFCLEVLKLINRDTLLT